MVLGEIIELYSGRSYENYYKDSILTPLGIYDMHLGKDSVERKRQREVFYVGNGYKTLSSYGTGQFIGWQYGGNNIEAMDAHGGWIATPKDLLKLMVSVDGFSTVPDILSSASINLMTTTSPNNSGYANGWSVNGANNWWHTGALTGTATLLVRTSGGYTWTVLINHRILGANSSNFWSDLDGLPWNCIASINTIPSHDLFDEPKLNASQFNFTNQGANSVSVSWQNGDGNRRILVAKKDSSSIAYPTDGISYSANSFFGLGDTIGDNTYVLYDGTGNNVTVQNMLNGQDYYFRLFEYNQSANTGSNKLYLQGGVEEVLYSRNVTNLSVSTSVNSHVSCNGNSDGSATANASGGTSPYTYIWSSGSSNATNTGLSAGIYTVTVADNAGSTNTATATINEPSSIGATLTATDESCAKNDGTISTSVSGGTAPYNFSWSTSATTMNISNLTTGAYTVTITDANGCTSTSNAMVNDSCADNSNITLQPNFCGGSGFDPTNMTLFFQTRPDASNYRVRINGPGVSNFIITTALNRFNLNQVTGIQYGQTYTVEISAFVSGSFLAYGNSCNITTSSINGVANLMLKAEFCGATNLDPGNTLIYFRTRSDASRYFIRVNGPGVSNFVHTATINRFNLNDITGIQYGQTYSFEVAAIINSQQTSYGPPCNITTGAVTSIIDITFFPRDCGITHNPTNKVLYFRKRAGVTNYRIRVNGPGISNATHTTTNAGFNLNVFTGWQAGQTYTLEIAATINGQFSNYGTPCTITTPPVLAPSIRKASLSRLDERVNTSSELTVYPNPSLKEIVYIQYNKLDAIDNERVELEIYNVNGQRVIRKLLQFNNGKVITDINVESVLNSGVYFVNIIDGEDILTEKLIVL